MDETFSVYEAARQMGCTSQWIRVLLAEQRLTGAQKIKGQWRIPATALEPRLEMIRTARSSAALGMSASNRLTPDAVAGIRERANETLQRLNEASTVEKEMGVRDPELEQIDTEWQEWKK
jgi:hypothetical protein